MGVPGYVESLLGGVEAGLKRVLSEAFRYALMDNRFGPVDHQVKAESFSGYTLLSTTAATGNEEFSVIHGMGRTPFRIMQVAGVSESSGDRLGVTLTVSRPADSHRLYFRSASTSVPFALYVE